MTPFAHLEKSANIGRLASMASRAAKGFGMGLKGVALPLSKAPSAQAIQELGRAGYGGLAAGMAAIPATLVAGLNATRRSGDKAKETDGGPRMNAIHPDLKKILDNRNAGVDVGMNAARRGLTKEQALMEVLEKYRGMGGSGRGGAVPGGMMFNAKPRDWPQDSQTEKKAFARLLGTGIARAGTLLGRGLAGSGQLAGRGLAGASQVAGSGLAGASQLAGKGIVNAGRIAGRGLTGAANAISQRGGDALFNTAYRMRNMAPGLSNSLLNGAVGVASNPGLIRSGLKGGLIGGGLMMGLGGNEQQGGPGVVAPSPVSPQS